jgi:hypothetical protein
LHPVNSRFITGYNVATTALTNAVPYVACLNVMGEGSDETQRVGDRGYMKWLKMNLVLLANATLLLPTVVRVMIVKEKTTLGSALAPIQFLQGGGTPVTTSQRNYTTRDHSRYKIYYDESFTVCPPSSPAATIGNMALPSQMMAMHKQIPLGFMTDYSRGSAGTVADIDTNGLSILIFTDNGVANAVFGYYSYVINTDF